MWHACEGRKEGRKERMKVRKAVVFHLMMPSTATNVVSVAHE